MHRTILKMKIKLNIGVKLIRDEQANLNKLNCPGPEKLYELGNKTKKKVVEEPKLMIRITY